MTNDKIYLIAESLAERAAGHEMSNRKWVFAIYKALLVHDKNDNSGVNWKDNYKQWDIDHQFRGSKSSAKKTEVAITRLSVTIQDETCSIVKAIFSKAGVETEESICYRMEDFKSYLWETPNPKNETLLLSEFERDILYRATLSGENVHIDNVGIVQQQENSLLDIEPPSHPHQSPNNLTFYTERQAKFEALKKLLDGVRQSYEVLSEAQRSFLEVIVGAAVFYIPPRVEHFCGYISLNAINADLTGHRKVKDHIFPRKLAGKRLLEKELSLDELIAYYNNTLASFMYVTSSENNLLVNYYNDYLNHDEALKALKIIKFPNNEEEKFKSHKELLGFLRSIQSSTEVTIESIRSSLVEYRLKNM